MATESDGKGGAADNGEFNQASPMLLSALLPSAIKSVYLLPVKFHHGARNVLVITSCKPIGKWFSWLGACALPAVFALACPRPIRFTTFSPSRGDPRHSAYHFAPRLSVTRTQKRDTRDQCDLPPFHNRPYSFTDTALPIEGRSQLSMAFTHCTLLLLFDSTSRP